MLFNIESVLWEVLVKVFLEGFKANCVAVFMLTIIISMLLKAVVG